MIRCVAILLAVCCLGLAVGIVILMNRDEVAREQTPDEAPLGTIGTGVDPEPLVDWPVDFATDASRSQAVATDERSWRCENCRVTTSGLVFDGTASAQALFLREFRHLMLEFQVKPTSDEGALDVRLFSQSSKSQVTMRFDESGVTVFEGTPSRGKVLAQEEVDLELEAGRSKLCRIGATGNRIIVNWGTDRVLTCDQPAAQSGLKVLFAIKSEGGGFELTEFRIEGE